MKAPRPPSGRCKRLTDGSAGGSRRRGISESRRPDSTGPLPAIRMRQQRRNSPQPGGGAEWTSAGSAANRVTVRCRSPFSGVARFV